MSLAKRLLYNEDKGDRLVTQQGQTVLNVVANMKHRSRPATMPWTTFLRYALAEKLQDICNDLRDIISDVQDKRNAPASVDAR